MAQDDPNFPILNVAKQQTRRNIRTKLSALKGYLLVMGIVRLTVGNVVEGV